jgi:hypothetical protein
MARERIEPLAKIIMSQNNDDRFLSTQYLNENVLNEEQALQVHEILLPSGLMKIYMYVNNCEDCISEKQVYTIK